MVTGAPVVAVLDDEPEMRKALRRFLTCRAVRVEESRVQATILRTFQDAEEQDEAAVGDRLGLGLGEERPPAGVKAQTGAPVSAGRQINQPEC